MKFLFYVENSVNPARVGVVIGSAFGGLDSFEKAVNDLAQFGPSAVGPYTIPMILGPISAYFCRLTLQIVSLLREHAGGHSGDGNGSERA